MQEIAELTARIAVAEERLRQFREHIRNLATKDKPFTTSSCVLPR